MKKERLLPKLSLTPIPMASPIIMLSVLVLFSCVLSLTTVIADNVLFSEPDQVLVSFGNNAILDGDMRLELQGDCRLVLYQEGSIVFEFDTSVPSAAGCLLFVDRYGQVNLRPADSNIPTKLLGTRLIQGRYALALTKGTLGIYGPPIWSSSGGGVPSQSHAQHGYHRGTKNNLFAAVKQARSGRRQAEENCIFSGSSEDQVVMRCGNFSLQLVSQPYCNLALLHNGAAIWETDTGYEPTTGRCQVSVRPDGELFLGEVVAIQGLEQFPVTYRVWGSGVSSTTRPYFCAITRIADYTANLRVFGMKDCLYGDCSAGRIKMVAGK